MLFHEIAKHIEPSLASGCKRGGPWHKPPSTQLTDLLQKRATKRIVLEHAMPRGPNHSAPPTAVWLAIVGDEEPGMRVAR